MESSGRQNAGVAFACRPPSRRTKDISLVIAEDQAQSLRSCLL